MMNRSVVVRRGLRLKSGLKAGAIVCFDNSSGFLVPVITPCSTPTPLPPLPPAPGVQWLSCQSCAGTRLADGSLQDAVCEVCFM